MHKNVNKWEKDSEQYKQRLLAVEDMVIETSYPVTIVDQPSFRVDEWYPPWMQSSQFQVWLFFRHWLYAGPSCTIGQFWLFIGDMQINS